MVNRAILIGNIGKDPELSTLPNGNKVCKFSLATSESYKDKNGEWQQQTEWHNITFWGDMAERAARLAKGNTLYVEGKITYRTYEKDGVKRYSTEITGNYYRILKREERAEQPKETQPAPVAAEGDDDLPF